MAQLSLSNAEIVRKVLQVMGFNRDAGEMDTATEADVRAIMRAGLRRFYFPAIGDMVYQWRWLEKFHSIPAVATYSTGTIAISAGTATLTGGVWPSYAVDMYIVADGHTLFVTERTSDTVVQISHTTLTVAASSSYEAFRYRYDLPSDFAEWVGGVVFQNGSKSRMLAGSSDAEIRLRYAVGQGTGYDTSHFAVTAGPDDQEWKIWLWPVPDEGDYIRGVYLSTPDDNLPADLTSPGSTIQVQPIYAEALVEAILAAAEEFHNDEVAGMHEAKFQTALRRAIAHDKSVGGPYDFSYRAADTRSEPTVLPIDWSNATI